MLVVDVGNSRTAAALWAGGPGAAPPQGELTRLPDRPTPRDAGGRRELAAALAALARARGATALVLASVVPAVDAGLADAGLTGAGPRVLRVDHAGPLPFALDVEEPAAVGADRYCNVAAAVGRGWRDALVVDAGTATTVDLLREGRFAGGLIAPGMAFAARKLGEEAARLRPVPFAPCPLDVGRTTAAAMQAGAFHVGVNGVVATVAALRERYGRPPVAVTGGLAPFLVQPGWLHDPDWTLRGALLLAAPRLGEA